MAQATLQRGSLMQNLRNRGVRITAQRKALLDAIQEADIHLDAATLLARARGRHPSVDRATVYRTLDLLKRFGLIDELDLMHLNGEKHYYEARTKNDHIHLACFRCGSVEEFTSSLYEELKAEMARVRGFNVQVSRLEVGGMCASCARPSKEARGEGRKRV